ncbi:MAPEG family protein [Maricaulis sp.]|uniref:MAPEG family protein n=1 Tax=Maricaulis sp. TaxID=1486257 RepID=UPI002620A3FF|nr:MAPEG family protein [Maricaulis sp.]MDF1769013.1 MAPEG family protein [Maricaulis sp.]
MTALDAFALYTGINGLLIIALAFNVIRHRQRAKVGIGIGNDEKLELACRVHGNAVEYIPVALVIIGGLALTNAPILLIHGLGIGLTVGRLLHAWGLSQSSGSSMGRFIGTLLSWLVTIIGSLFLIWTAIS